MAAFLFCVSHWTLSSQCSVVLLLALHCVASSMRNNQKIHSFSSKLLFSIEKIIKIIWKITFIWLHIFSSNEYEFFLCQKVKTCIYRFFFSNSIHNFGFYNNRWLSLNNKYNVEDWKWLIVTILLFYYLIDPSITCLYMQCFSLSTYATNSCTFDSIEYGGYVRFFIFYRIIFKIQILKNLFNVFLNHWVYFF